MINIEKRFPGPRCLEEEKEKPNGTYRCGDVLDRLKDEFHNKCYICEYKEPTNINVEHFIPHEGDRDLKFEWSNLFWSCSHCNNIKSNGFTNILNCTDPNDHVETDIKYTVFPIPFDEPRFTIVNDSERVRNTRELLLDVYFGTTEQKKLESSNLREKLLDEMTDFCTKCRLYFKDTTLADDKRILLIEIKSHISKKSNFSAFKRWTVRNNEKLNAELSQFFD